MYSFRVKRVIKFPGVQSDSSSGGGGGSGTTSINNIYWELSHPEEVFDRGVRRATGLSLYHSAIYLSGGPATTLQTKTYTK